MRPGVRRVPGPLPLVYGADGWPAPAFIRPDPLQQWDSLLWARWGSGAPAGVALHCFVEDWRFETAWRRPELTVSPALLAGIVVAPDFSISWSDPEPWAAHQVWRSRSVGHFWAAHGAVVVPVLQWGGPQTWPACARGIRPGSVVAVRGPSVACGRSPTGGAVQTEGPHLEGLHDRWLQGANYLQRVLNPGSVIQFGNSYGSEVWQCRVFTVPLFSRAARRLRKIGHA